MGIDWDGWVEIFRAGDFGVKGTYTEAELDKIVSSYNPKLHEAPITIGHPEHDRPAFGWVASLKREGNRLLARFANVQDDFKRWIRRGLYKSRSVSLYLDLGGTGPYLRHVGFLGAMPPEVKSLAPLPTFAEGENESVHFDFQDRQGGLMQWLKGRSTDVVTNAELKKFEESLEDKIDRLIREQLGDQLAGLAEKMGDKLSDVIHAAMVGKLMDVEEAMRKEVRDMVYQKVNESVARNPLFGEARQTISQRYPRKVQFIQGDTPAVGIELAEEAEALADEEGLPYREALGRIQSQRAATELQATPAKTHNTGDVAFTEHPYLPAAGFELAQRADSVSKERGISYREALRLVKQAEQVSKTTSLSFTEALRLI